MDSQSASKSTEMPVASPLAHRRSRDTFPIAGLSCGGGGALTVERALLETPGVIRAYVNAATEMAYVEFDPGQTGLVDLKEAIESTGCRTTLPGGAR